ncbi:uncharacterized protein LOC110378753 [Helicoverpa armigera]|uniref:uncharacterized protein LOC110378753 n=1 Tax=Helicoverpa armigera TaxID=29058 RepID=UPI00308275A4
MYILLILCSIFKISSGDVTSNDVAFLNDLPLDKLLRLKSSLQDLVTVEYENVTTTTPSYIQRFGAEAMAIQGPPPVKRGDYEEGLYKKESYSKISNIFSMSVTTLAFLAFGGYLLCLIVQAVKAKQTYNAAIPTTQPTTFFVSAGIKKRPQSQFSAYGRRRRDNRFRRSLKMVDLPPEQLFEALLQVCEGYAKWSERKGDIGDF